ncbi:MAG: ClpXP protease specificity-enhancing factor [Candidatus Berkiella sp.]
MVSSRPYLLRAFYDWIVDNHATPYIVVNADHPGAEVPREYVENGRIVLNISPDAVRSLSLANDHVGFNARFAGVAYDIYIPMRAVTAIYAKENGRGMVFKDDEDDEFPRGPEDDDSSASGSGGKGKKGNGRPKLTVVK